MVALKTCSTFNTTCFAGQVVRSPLAPCPQILGILWKSMDVNQINMTFSSQTEWQLHSVMAV